MGKEERRQNYIKEVESRLEILGILKIIRTFVIVIIITHKNIALIRLNLF
jgi:hypothetical protein